MPWACTIWRLPCPVAAMWMPSTGRFLLELPDAVVEDPPVDCPEYRDGYYATYFLDPDGIKLEVVFAP